MHRHLKTFLYKCILFCLCCGFGTMSYAVVQTKLSRDSVALGETIAISYNLNKLTNKDSSPDFSPLRKDFRIIGTNYRTAINITNGVAQSQMLWEVTLEPKTVGEVIIPEINFGNDKSTSQKIKVFEAKSAIKRNENGQTSSAFVEAYVDTTSPMVQSQLLYTFKLFYRTQLENPTIEAPHITNATLVEIVDGQSYQTTIKGEPFLVFEKKFAIFPQHTGKVIIPPTRFRAVNFNFHRSLIDDPFSIPFTRPVTLATRAFTLDVKPIPEAYHGKIWLPAKNITLTEEWSADAKHWEVGSPITRTITIKALGLRADQIPDQVVDHIAQVNLYTETPHRENSFQGSDVLGTWQQKITYIPNQSQSFILPAFSLNWWDTQKQTEARAELKELNVQVKGNAEQSTSIGSSGISTSINAVDMPVPRKLDATITNPPINVKTLESNNPFYFSFWFWISFLLLIVWLLTLSRIYKNKILAIYNASATATKQKSVKNLDKLLPQKLLIEACKSCDAKMAQQQLLAWAKTKWKDAPQNLEKLRESINDAAFKEALKDLELVLYADNKTRWDAQTFLMAYQQFLKSQNCSMARVRKREDQDSHPLTQTADTSDPLPPLNP